MRHLQPCFLFAIVLTILLSCSPEQEHLMSERGYVYKKHTNHDGSTPQEGEYAYFHIKMRVGDSVLNTSYTMAELPRLKIPAKADYTRQTPVIVDGLKLMCLGDSLTLDFPLDSFPTRPPAFEDIDLIQYDLVLMDIKTDEEFKAEQQKLVQEREVAKKLVQARMPEIESLSKKIVEDYVAGKSSGVQEAASGLKYIIHEQGTGKRATIGSVVSVQYYGTLMDGKMFDNSFSRGEAYTFPVGQGRVVKGWDEGIPLLNQGGKASLFIPYQMAYGEAGNSGIPGKANLYFYVELEKVK